VADADPLHQRLKSIAAVSLSNNKSISIPVLAQANEPGRVVEVRSLLLHNPPKYHEVDSPVTLCTADSGKLTLYFTKPGFDMVQLTAVSYGTSSGKSRPMNTQSVMLYFPTVVPKSPS
jgi:hypothetical protein